MPDDGLAYEQSINMQYFMISPHNEWVYCTFKPVFPLLQGQRDCKQLTISYIVILLSWREASGEKGSGVEFMVNGRSLGEHSTHS